MFHTGNDQRVTAAQLLVPVFIMAVTLAVLFGIQFCQILTDRQDLHATYSQQEKPLGEAQRLQGQVQALVIGTMKLADKGDKDAKAIVEMLKQIGVVPSAPAAAQPAQGGFAPVPAANEIPEQGPAKP